MQTRKLRDLEVSAIGYGAMGLSMGYGATPTKDESIELIRKAYDLGCTFFDTAEVYSMGVNEQLVGEALKSMRNKVVIATKFLFQKDWDGNSKERLMKELRGRLEHSLRMLDTEQIDLYYQHRVNQDIPVEDIAWCMGEFIKEGKILGWGQSQASVDDIRRAHAVTPLTAIQSEFSIMERMFEKDVIPLCEELNIGFVPFSPLASGFLSGKLTTETKYAGIDARRVITRFEKDNIIANQPLLDLLQKFAKEKEATPAQISLAWMLHKKDFIVPIPGSTNLARITENLAAAELNLTDDEYANIESELAKIKIHGNRTDEDMMKLWSLDQ